MKKLIIAGVIALSCSASATAAELGLYFGDATFLTYSSHKPNTSGFTINLHWATQDTGDTYGWSQNKISFKTFGGGLGYSYDDLIDKLSLEGVAGYGLSDVKIDNTNLNSIEFKSGLYYSLGASYQVLNHVPFSVGVKLMSVPTFDWTTSTGLKTYGGTSVIVGGSYAF